VELDIDTRMSTVYSLLSTVNKNRYPVQGPIKISSLVDRVAERLEWAITNGELSPGSRLSEQALAKEFGVSRGPLREALRRLEGRKLIERKPNIGPRVATLSESKLREIFSVREALEGLACRLAAEQMTDQELSQLQGLVEEHGRHGDLQSGSSYYQEPEGRDLHFRIVRASRNEWLFELLCGDVYRLLRVYRYQSSVRPGRARHAYEEHRAIVAALAARDADAAEALMRHHIRNARDQLLGAVAGKAPKSNEQLVNVKTV
jgi:DNA-binding GntR family transcriptional regulator